MKQRFLRAAALLFAVILCLSGCASSPVNAPGASGEAKENPRIAATSVAICEILDALEYDNVVGVPVS